MKPSPPGDQPAPGRQYRALRPGLAGLVLASTILVSESLASGLLVQYRPEIGVPGAGYSLLCVPGRERHPPVRAFCEWLAHELG